MSRGFFVVLTLLVLAAALFAGWWSNRRAVYFPVELQSAYSLCENRWGPAESQLVQDDFEASWFSDELANLEEPSLFARPKGATRSVRFTWLRSFHDPIAVRIDTTAEGRLRMTARRNPMGNDLDPYAKNTRLRRLTRNLTAEESAELEALLDRTAVLAAPSNGCRCCVDGARWIVESSDPRHGYRYHNSQSPKSGPERQVGEFLLSLTGWDVEPVY